MFPCPSIFPDSTDFDNAGFRRVRRFHRKLTLRSRQSASVAAARVIRSQRCANCWRLVDDVEPDPFAPGGHASHEHGARVAVGDGLAVETDDRKHAGRSAGRERPRRPRPRRLATSRDAWLRFPDSPRNLQQHRLADARAESSRPGAAAALRWPVEHDVGRGRFHDVSCWSSIRARLPGISRAAWRSAR